MWQLFRFSCLMLIVLISSMRTTSMLMHFIFKETILRTLTFFPEVSEYEHLCPETFQVVHHKSTPCPITNLDFHLERTTQNDEDSDAHMKFIEHLNLHH